WFPSLSVWIPSILFVLLIMALNLVSVNLFGEMEFWFASIKIVAIMAIILAGVVMVITGFTSPVSGHAAAVSNLWEYGGWFPKGAFGFFAGFQIAMFAFVGIELIGTTAAEAKDPEVNLPKAINTIPFRIVFFYVFALVAIMCITPWTEINPETSPFVHTFVAVGIPAAASIVNFVVLTSAASSANSGIYSTSRMLYGLSLVGVAPKAFGRLSSHRVPANGLLFSCLCLLLGASMLIIMPTIMAAFTVMTTISSVCFIFVWSMILYSYVVYRKRHPERHETSKFKLPGGILSCWLCWIFFAVVLVLLTFEADTRMAMFTTPIWFVILGIGYYLSHKNHVAKR
ncbi:MAG: amino acid permease, partial [Desulfovibrio sp.]|uniref:amino acid permease n=1 Tax=Desulfovibrio sp. TaxID=885 RepID=UPI0039E5FF94